MSDSEQFEKTVAQLFRDAGAEVQQDIDVGGNQIDVLATFRVIQIPVSIAVECKYYNTKVGKEIVNKFASVVGLLRALPGESKVDRGLIVSRLGFTRPARRAASVHSIDLRTVEDIIACISGAPPDEIVGSYGAEAYTIISAMDGIYLDAKRNMFWRLFNSACRMRKWSPEVDQYVLWNRARECHELAVDLDSVHRAAAYMLDGVLHYDEKQFGAAEEGFKDALAVATGQPLRPIFLQALFWQARCNVERELYPQALELMERCWAGSHSDMALASFRAKAQYWRAKIYWMAFEKGVRLKGSGEIKELFRDSFHVSDKLGIINYREGARARLAEIAIQEGSAQYGLEQLLRSYELTPNLQDRRKLEPIIAKACLEIPAEIQSRIEDRVKRELERFRWITDSRHTPDVQVCEYAVWRFSKFERLRILPYIDGGSSNWIAGTRQLLEDPELFEYCIEADGNSRQGPTAESESRTQKYTSLRRQIRAQGSEITGSNLKHRLRMCRRLFFSSALVNDTGQRGSLSLVALNKDAETKILERRNCDFRIDEVGGFFCHATTQSRLSLSEQIRRDLREATTRLTAKVFEKVPTRGVFPVSLDFLIEADRFCLLEFHYPSRGFDVLYEPFSDLITGAILPVDIYANQIDQFIKELPATSILLTHNSLFYDDRDRPRSQFYGFEFQRVANKIIHQVRSAKVYVCDDLSQTARKNGVIQYQGMTPEIVIVDDVDPCHPILGESSQLVLPNSDMISLLSLKSYDFCARYFW